MGRSKGSSSTKEAKNIAHELEQLTNIPNKYNLDSLRLSELLLCYRVAEEVCRYNDDEPVENKITQIEIPLIGNLTIKPRIFHEKHRLTDEPSIHFDFTFEPTNRFKADIMKAYMNKETDLTDIFSSIYGDRLRDLYNRMREE